jgi:hypothetical protein
MFFEMVDYGNHIGKDVADAPVREQFFIEFGDDRVNVFRCFDVAHGESDKKREFIELPAVELGPAAHGLRFSMQK